MYTKGGKHGTGNKLFYFIFRKKQRRHQIIQRFLIKRLYQMVDFFSQKGIEKADEITATNLNSYILFMEKEGKAPSTISRNIASIKAFFHYLMQEGKIKREPTDELKPPKIKKKAPEILSINQVDSLLKQPSGKTKKEYRDKAMLELLYRLK
jgi:integrase/recombinase XerD